MSETCGATSLWLLSVKTIDHQTMYDFKQEAGIIKNIRLSLEFKDVGKLNSRINAYKSPSCMYLVCIFSIFTFPGLLEVHKCSHPINLVHNEASCVSEVSNIHVSTPRLMDISLRICLPLVSECWITLSTKVNIWWCLFLIRYIW